MPQPKKFAGKEEALGDEHVCQHTEGRDATDQSSRTTEEIIRHASAKCKNCGVAEHSLSDEVAILFPMPPAPAAFAEADGVPPCVPEADMMAWKMKVQLTLQQSSLLALNLESACALLKGQSSKPISEKVEAQQGCLAVHQARDPIGLLWLLKGVMFKHNSKKHRAMSLITIFKPDLVSQSRSMSDSEHLEKFRTQLEVMKSAGGDICGHNGMMEDELTRAGVVPTAANGRKRGLQPGRRRPMRHCQDAHRDVTLCFDVQTHRRCPSEWVGQQCQWQYFHLGAFEGDQRPVAVHPCVRFEGPWNIATSLTRRIACRNVPVSLTSCHFQGETCT
jgi:hypothetical protein